MDDIKFEYKTIRLTSWRNENDWSDEQLTKLGDEGWELASTYQTDGVVRAIFKRTIKNK